MRSPGYLIVLAILAIWYLADPSNEAAIALIAMLVLLGITYAWARAMAINVTGQRKLHYSAFQVGDELEELVTLFNASSLPVLWAEFQDRSNLPDYTVAGIRAVDGHNSTEWRACTLCTQRGRFSLGPWELHLGEPVGLFQVQQKYPEKLDILVYPPLAVLPDVFLPHQQSAGSHRPLRQALAAETISVFSTRPYLPGDPLRRVHWRTSARQGKLHVKQFDPETTSTAWLIPDFDAAVHWGNGPESSLEKMIILTASLASQLLRSHISVGLLANDGSPQIVTPRPGTAQLWPVLNVLSPMQPTYLVSLAQTLHDARPLVTSRDLLIVITPSLHIDWPHELSRASSGGRAIGAEVVLLDPQSFGGPSGCESFAAWLTALGIPTRQVRSEDIRPLAGTFGSLSRWEFKTLGSGRVIVRHSPRLAGMGR
jgi:uncharacterized protein (DUF58 family)